MGIFDKLFEKKVCDICGGEIGLLGNRKLEDGNCCKDCAAKLSPWFDERRHSTIADIKQQLEYREQNKVAVGSFNPSLYFGDDKKVLMIDMTNKTFAVGATGDLQNGNPDIVQGSAITSFEMKTDEHRHEIYRKDSQGHNVSYNPRRYEYEYDFTYYIYVSHPYFDEMKFKLNNRRIEVREASTAHMIGGLARSLSGGSIPNLNPAFARYEQMNQEIGSYLQQLQNSSLSQTTTAQGVNGSANAVTANQTASAAQTAASAAVAGSGIAIGTLLPGAWKVAGIDESTGEYLLKRRANGSDEMMKATREQVEQAIKSGGQASIKSSGNPQANLDASIEKAKALNKKALNEYGAMGSFMGGASWGGSQMKLFDGWMPESGSLGVGDPNEVIKVCRQTANGIEYASTTRENFSALSQASMVLALHPELDASEDSASQTITQKDILPYMGRTLPGGWTITTINNNIGRICLQRNVNGQQERATASLEEIKQAIDTNDAEAISRASQAYGGKGTGETVAAAQPQPAIWTCPFCHHQATGNFCGNCGAAKQ